MINLDQVRTLEWKVKQTVQLIVQLRRENDMLRGRLSDTEVRLQELESMVEAFKVAQTQMETGIRTALDELDHIETDSVDLAPPAKTEAEPEPEVSAPVMALETEPALEPALDAEADAAFEEEYAALVAEEAASLVDPAPAAEPAPAEEAAAEPEPEPETAEAKEDRDDQPGLGIF
jgi:hypothetical protein